MYKRDEISLLEREIVADSIDEFKMILDMLDYNIDVYDKKFAKNFDGFNPQSKQYQKCNPLHIVMNILKNLIMRGGGNNILFFIDNNSIKYNQEINISIDNKDFTFLIKHPQEVLHTQFDKIFIATMTGCESCLKQLSSYGVDMAKVDSNYVMVKIQARINFLKSFAKECKDKGIVGNVAEVGVFQGEFAKKINTYFPP